MRLKRRMNSEIKSQPRKQSSYRSAKQSYLPKSAKHDLTKMDSQSKSAFEQFELISLKGSLISHNTSYEATLTEAELREINEKLKK